MNQFPDLNIDRLRDIACHWINDVRGDLGIGIERITLYRYRASIPMGTWLAERHHVDGGAYISPLKYAVVFTLSCPGKAPDSDDHSTCHHSAYSSFIARYTSHMAAAHVDIPPFAVNGIRDAYKSDIPSNFMDEWIFLPYCSGIGCKGIFLPAGVRTDEPSAVLYDTANLTIPGQKNKIPEQLKPCSFHALDIPFLRSIAYRWGNDYHEEGLLIDRITLHPMGIPPSLKEVLHNPVKSHKYAVVFHCPDCTSDDLSIQDTAAEILDKISGDGFSPYHSLFSATQERGSGSILFYESFENVYLKPPPEDWQKEWRFVLLYSGAVVSCDVWQNTGIELYKAGITFRAKENHLTAKPITGTKNERLPGTTSEKNGRKDQDEEDQEISIDDNKAISLSDKNRKEYLGDPTVIFDSRDEALEKNLWDIHIKPIVDLHFNSASGLQYEYFPEPSCITQGDLNSIWNNILFHFHTSDYEPEEIKDVIGFLAAGMPDTERNVSIKELKLIFHPLLKKILKDKTLPSFLMFIFHECDVNPCKGTDESCQSKGHVKMSGITNHTKIQQNGATITYPNDSCQENELKDTGHPITVVKKEASHPLIADFQRAIDECYEEVGLFWDCLKRKAKDQNGGMNYVNRDALFEMAKDIYQAHQTHFQELKMDDIENKDFYVPSTDRKRTIIGNVLRQMISRKCPRALSSIEIKTSIESLHNLFRSKQPFKSQ